MVTKEQMLQRENQGILALYQKKALIKLKFLLHSNRVLTEPTIQVEITGKARISVSQLLLAS